MNIKDVARMADVSISTVSRVINNTAKVNEDTRARVEKVIEETNYRPNVLARELQQNKTNTIGVLMSAVDLDISSISETINAISDILKENNYNIMLANSRFHMEEEFDFFRTFQDKRVDGVLYFAAGFTDKHESILKSFPAPIVMIGQQFNKLDIPSVIHDDFHASKEATMYLINKGHEKIAFIGCPMYDEAAGIKRVRGFESALESVNLIPNPLWIKESDFTLQGGYDSMINILDCHEELPSAVFAATDYMAIGAMRAIEERDLKVPEDISVMGFDDVQLAAFCSPRLTSIHTDKKSVGEIAAKMLIKTINTKVKTKEIVTVKHSLVERDSVATLKEL